MSEDPASFSLAKLVKLANLVGIPEDRVDQVNSREELIQLVTDAKSRQVDTTSSSGYLSAEEFLGDVNFSNAQSKNNNNNNINMASTTVVSQHSTMSRLPLSKDWFNLSPDQLLQVAQDSNHQEINKYAMNHDSWDLFNTHHLGKDNHMTPAVNAPYVHGGGFPELEDNPSDAEDVQGDNKADFHGNEVMNGATQIKGHEGDTHNRGVPSVDRMPTWIARSLEESKSHNPFSLFTPPVLPPSHLSNTPLSPQADISPSIRSPSHHHHLKHDFDDERIILSPTGLPSTSTSQSDRLSSLNPLTSLSKPLPSGGGSTIVSSITTVSTDTSDHFLYNEPRHPDDRNTSMSSTSTIITPPNIARHSDHASSTSASQSLSLPTTVVDTHRSQSVISPPSSCPVINMHIHTSHPSHSFLRLNDSKTNNNSNITNPCMRPPHQSPSLRIAHSHAEGITMTRSTNDTSSGGINFTDSKNSRKANGLTFQNPQSLKSSTPVEAISANSDSGPISLTTRLSNPTNPVTTQINMKENNNKQAKLGIVNKAIPQVNSQPERNKSDENRYYETPFQGFLHALTKRRTEITQSNKVEKRKRREKLHSRQGRGNHEMNSVGISKENRVDNKQDSDAEDDEEEETREEDDMSRGLSLLDQPSLLDDDSIFSSTIGSLGGRTISESSSGSHISNQSDVAINGTTTSGAPEADSISAPHESNAKLFKSNAGNTHDNQSESWSNSGSSPSLSSEYETRPQSDFNERFQSLMELAETTDAQTRKKYEALAQLSIDFVETAKTYTRLIIDEMHLPSQAKSVQPVSIGGVAGGQKYLVRGIVFKVLRDPIVIKATPTQPAKYLYGGDHPMYEFAAKAAGHALKGAAAYFDCGIGRGLAESSSMVSYSTSFDSISDVTSSSSFSSSSATSSATSSAESLTKHMSMKEGQKRHKDQGLARHEHLRVGLQALVEYRGFRLVAEPYLPLTDKVIYGSADGGRTVHRSDSHFNRMMEHAATTLHLSGHMVGNVYLHAAGDIEGRVGRDGRYYLLDTARAFPCEFPLLCTHLPRIGGTVFYRLLRPELLQILKSRGFEPLSPDALTGWGRGPDSKLHGIRVRNATAYLLQSIIPSFARWLDGLCGIDDITDSITDPLNMNASSASRSTEASSTFSTPSSYPLPRTPDLPVLPVPASQLIHARGINMRHIGLLRSYVVHNTHARAVLLIEMVSRTIKNILRSWQRHVSELDSEYPSEYDIKQAVAAFLNLLTGAMTDQSSRLSQTASPYPKYSSTSNQELHNSIHSPRPTLHGRPFQKTALDGAGTYSAPFINSSPSPSNDAESRSISPSPNLSRFASRVSPPMPSLHSSSSRAFSRSSTYFGYAGTAYPGLSPRVPSLSRFMSIVVPPPPPSSKNNNTVTTGKLVTTSIGNAVPSSPSSTLVSLTTTVPDCKISRQQSVINAVFCASALTTTTTFATLSGLSTITPISISPSDTATSPCTPTTFNTSESNDTDGRDISALANDLFHRLNLLGDANVVNGKYTNIGTGQTRHSNNFKQPKSLIPSVNEVWSTILEGIKQRFGEVGLTEYEKANISIVCAPYLSLIIQYALSMCGLSLTPVCKAELASRDPAPWAKEPQDRILQKIINDKKKVNSTMLPEFSNTTTSDADNKQQTSFESNLEEKKHTHFDTQLNHDITANGTTSTMTFDHMPSIITQNNDSDRSAGRSTTADLASLNSSAFLNDYHHTSSHKYRSPGIAVEGEQIGDLTKLVKGWAMGFEFSFVDLDDGDVRVKHLSVLDYAKGKLLQSRGVSRLRPRPNIRTALKYVVRPLRMAGASSAVLAVILAGHGPTDTNYTKYGGLDLGVDSTSGRRLVSLALQNMSAVLRSHPNFAPASRESAICHSFLASLDSDPYRADDALLTPIEQAIETLGPAVYISPISSKIKDSAFPLQEAANSSTHSLVAPLVAEMISSLAHLLLDLWDARTLTVSSFEFLGGASSMHALHRLSRILSFPGLFPYIYASSKSTVSWFLPSTVAKSDVGPMALSPAIVSSSSSSSSPSSSSTSTSLDWITITGQRPLSIATRIAIVWLRRHTVMLRCLLRIVVASNEYHLDYNRPQPKGDGDSLNDATNGQPRDLSQVSSTSSSSSTSTDLPKRKLKPRRTTKTGTHNQTVVQPGESRGALSLRAPDTSNDITNKNGNVATWKPIWMRKAEATDAVAEAEAMVAQAMDPSRYAAGLVDEGALMVAQEKLRIAMNDARHKVRDDLKESADDGSKVEGGGGLNKGIVWRSAKEIEELEKKASEGQVLRVNQNSHEIGSSMKEEKKGAIGNEHLVASVGTITTASSPNDTAIRPNDYVESVSTNGGNAVIASIGTPSTLPTISDVSSSLPSPSVVTTLPTSLKDAEWDSDFLFLSDTDLALLHESGASSISSNAAVDTLTSSLSSSTPSPKGALSESSESSSGQSTLKVSVSDAFPARVPPLPPVSPSPSSSTLAKLRIPSVLPSTAALPAQQYLRLVSTVSSHSTVLEQAITTPRFASPSSHLPQPFTPSSTQSKLPLSSSQTLESLSRPAFHHQLSTAAWLDNTTLTSTPTAHFTTPAPALTHALPPAIGHVPRTNDPREFLPHVPSLMGDGSSSSSTHGSSSIQSSFSPLASKDVSSTSASNSNSRWPSTSPVVISSDHDLLTRQNLTMQLCSPELLASTFSTQTDHILLKNGIPPDLLTRRARSRVPSGDGHSTSALHPSTTSPLEHLLPLLSLLDSYLSYPTPSHTFDHRNATNLMVAVATLLGTQTDKQTVSAVAARALASALLNDDSAGVAGMSQFGVTLFENRLSGRVGPDVPRFAVTFGSVKIKHGTPSEPVSYVTPLQGFPTVVGNVRVRSGNWYFQVKLRSTHIIQIGWANGDFRPDAKQLGVGDCNNSTAIDPMRGKCWHAQKSEKLWRKGERTRKELQDEGVLALTSPSHIGDESEDQKQVNSSTSSTSIKVRRRVHPVASFVTVKRSSGANDQSEHNDDYDDVGNDEKTRAKNDYDDDLDGTTFLKLEAEADNTTFASITRQALATIAPLTAVPGDVVTCIAYIDDPIPHARFFINDIELGNRPPLPSIGAGLCPAISLTCTTKDTSSSSSLQSSFRSSNKMKYAGTHSTIEYGGEGSILVAFTDGTQSSVDVQAGDGFVSRKRTYPTSASTSSLPTSSPNSTLAGTKSKSKKRTGVFDKGPPLSVLTGIRCLQLRSHATTLHRLCRYGRTSVTRLFIEQARTQGQSMLAHLSDPIRNPYRYSLIPRSMRVDEQMLFFASMDDRLAFTQSIGSISLDIVDEDRITPLMHAAAHGHTRTIRLLVAFGADPNFFTARLKSALTAAITAARADSVEALLRSGADPNKILRRFGENVTDDIYIPDAETPPLCIVYNMSAEPQYYGDNVQQILATPHASDIENGSSSALSVKSSHPSQTPSNISTAPSLSTATTSTTLSSSSSSSIVSRSVYALPEDFEMELLEVDSAAKLLPEAISTTSEVHNQLLDAISLSNKTTAVSSITQSMAGPGNRTSLTIPAPASTSPNECSGYATCLDITVEDTQQKIDSITLSTTASTAAPEEHVEDSQQGSSGHAPASNADGGKPAEVKKKILKKKKKAAPLPAWMAKAQAMKASTAHAPMTEAEREMLGLSPVNGDDQLRANEEKASPKETDPEMTLPALYPAISNPTAAVSTITSSTTPANTLEDTPSQRMSLPSTIVRSTPIRSEVVMSSVSTSETVHFATQCSSHVDPTTAAKSSTLPNSPDLPATHPSHFTSTSSISMQSMQDENLSSPLSPASFPSITGSASTSHTADQTSPPLSTPRAPQEHRVAVFVMSRYDLAVQKSSDVLANIAADAIQTGFAVSALSSIHLAISTFASTPAMGYVDAPLHTYAHQLAHISPLNSIEQETKLDIALLNAPETMLVTEDSPDATVTAPNVPLCSGLSSSSLHIRRLPTLSLYALLPSRTLSMLQTVQLLLLAGANPNSRDSSGRTPLFECAKNCTPASIASTALFLRYGAFASTRDVRGCTPLIVAAAAGNAHIIRLLLDAALPLSAVDSLPASISSTSEPSSLPSQLHSRISPHPLLFDISCDGETALTVAAASDVSDPPGWYDTFIDELCNGQDNAAMSETEGINQSNQPKPLEFSRSTPDESSSTIPFMADPDLALLNLVGQNTHHQEIENALCEGVPLMHALHAKQNVGASNISHLSPSTSSLGTLSSFPLVQTATNYASPHLSPSLLRMHAVPQPSPLTCMKLLIDAKADIDFLPSKSAALAAFVPSMTSSRPSEAMSPPSLLVPKPTNVPTFSIVDTPLCAATRGGHIHRVQLLLSVGADPLKRNARGLSPLDIAKKHGHVSIARLLEQAETLIGRSVPGI